MKILLAIFAMFVSNGQAIAGELHVLASVAAHDLIEEMLPAWKATTLTSPILEYDSAVGLRKKVSSGAPFDVIVSFASDVEEMRKAQLTQTAGEGIGTAYLVIIYKRGTEPPKATTPEELSALLRSAPSFAMADPALGGIGSILITEVARKTGIEDVLKSKLVQVARGQSAAAVAEGRAKFGVAQTTEIAVIREVAGSRLLAEDPRATTRLVVAVGANSNEKTYAEKFVNFMTSPESIQIRRDAGFEVP